MGFKFSKITKYSYKNIILNMLKKIYYSYLYLRFYSVKRFFSQRFFLQMIRRPYVANCSHEFRYIKSGVGLEYLLKNYDFNTVLDIGAGEGLHSDILKKYNKVVRPLDYGKSPYFEKSKDKESFLIGDYNKLNFSEKLDCIWASHVLEHQLNPNLFFKKIYADLKDDGILAITVPPMKARIVGGHVNLYNPGLLVYQAILAGFDCSDASLLWYDYNISLIVRKSKTVDLSVLTYDKDDIMLLKKYFPKGIQPYITKNFDGNISKINWK